MSPNPVLESSIYSSGIYKDEKESFYIEYRDNHSLVRELPISGNKNRISSTSKKEKAEITSFLLSQSRGSETPNEDSASTQLEVETRIRFKVHSIMRGRPSLVTKIGRGLTQIE